MKTPYYLIDEEKIINNCEILLSVEEQTGAKILLAQKAYSVYQTYPMIAEYLSGTTSSGLYEAKLAAEEFHCGRKSFHEIHVFEPAFEPEEMEEIVEISDHLYFNSLTQLEAHRKIWEPKATKGELKIALRLNPECSTQEGHAIYDPCAPGSRLGIREATLRGNGTLPSGVTGLHMHTLCEQGFDDLEKTWRAFESRFKDYLESDQITWVNLGGGHHITREDYDVDGLIELLQEIRDTYHVQVYLEPGEAVVLNAGELVTSVMDIVETDGLPVIILDTSAACHMPDVIEMPYTPPLREGVSKEAIESEADKQETKPRYTYRLGSRTCLSGDIVGDYTFEHEVSIGEKLHFEDMALYTMVKTNTFNGMPLPSIVLKHVDGTIEVLREFHYEDFKARL